MMKKKLSSVVLLALFGGWLGLSPGMQPAAAQEDPFAAGVRPTDPLSPEEEQAALKVPPGFRVTLVASEPDIPKPMNLAFDARGRIWVSGSNDYPWPNPENPGDSIHVLEDTNGDGRADKITKFVDGITIPIGLYPYRDGVIAFGIPHIWFFRDTDGDGVCDAREQLLGPFDNTRDTHGMQNGFRRGFDGWVYACHGFSNRSEVTAKDGSTVRLHSGNTYRFRADGSRIEQFTDGQVNPFGMAFNPVGDLYTSDCHTKPLMLMIRGGCYQSFGRPHDGLGFVPGVMDHSHGSTAIAGVSCYTGDRFPEEYRENFYIGNVMTSRVHRDSLSSHGSSVKAVEQPDFVISEDPWFRPVDTRCGPDGALYIADFYNKIIGHYEVPLNHPGRDRHRGRIWRVDYVGEDADAPLPQIPDLSRESAEQLIARLESPSLPERIRVMDQISDRLGQDAIPALKQSLSQSVSADARVAILWSLARLNALEEAEILAAAQREEDVVLIHVQRLLSERPDWSDALRELALQGLDSPVPLARRAAADALAQHPHDSQVMPIFAALQAVDPLDVHLQHALKIALRNHLRDPQRLMTLRQQPLDRSGKQILALICLGLDSPESASWLLEFVQEKLVPNFRVSEALGLIARQTSKEEVPQLEELIRKQHAGQPHLQVPLLVSVHDGLRQRGLNAAEELRPWALEISGQLLQTPPPVSRSNWTFEPERAGRKLTWEIEPRHSADGVRNQPFLSSLSGGEESRSRARSAPFTIPPRLSLFVAGHLGLPGGSAKKENFVRVCLVENDEEIARAQPPRNDTARKVEWDLTAHAGQQGYLEIVDGIDASAYAWIAVGRVEPPVVYLPAFSQSEYEKQIQNATLLIEDFELKEEMPAIRALLGDPETAHAAKVLLANTLAKLDGTGILGGLAGLFGSSALPDHWRQPLVESLASEEDHETKLAVLKNALRSLPTRLQVDSVRTLLNNRAGAILTDQLLAEGVLSPQIMQQNFVRVRLATLGTEEIAARSKELFRRLPSVDSEREELIRKLGRAYGQTPHDVEQGRKVFVERCIACHQVKGFGKVIGPQLDGIGSRGADRLLEDILDPNRNVDQAFRSRNYVLESGRIQTGVYRRNEGELIVLADNKGEEIKFPESEVEQHVVSDVSIMPDNWGELISESEMLDLLEFLIREAR